MPPRARRRQAARQGKPRTGGAPGGTRRLRPSRTRRLERRAPGDEAVRSAAIFPARSGPRLALGPVRECSLLIGAALALLTIGLTARLEPLFASRARPLEHAPGVVLGAVLLALSIGLRVPRRFALWALAAARRSVSRSGDPPPQLDFEMSPPNAERPMHWMALSVIMLTAGLTTAAIPAGVWIAAAFHGWMHAHFVWSPVPLIVLRALTVLLAGSLPLIALGVAVSEVHRLSCPFGRWGTSATAWLLTGTAGGTLLASAAAGVPARAQLMLLSAAFVTLTATLLAALNSAARSEKRESVRSQYPPSLPFCSDRWPRLLRAAIVWVGSTGAGLAWVWSVHTAQTAGQAHLPFVAAMLLAAGVGTLLACDRAGDGHRSIGGFGAASAAAGVIAAVAIPMAGAGETVPARTAPWIACLGLGAIAYAAAYGHRALLARVAGRPAAGAAVVARSLAASALLVGLVLPAWMPRVDLGTTVLAFSLGLVGLGGTLVIHEPADSTQTRRIRLCAIFASIGAMITLAFVRS